MGHNNVCQAGMERRSVQGLDTESLQTLLYLYNFTGQNTGGLAAAEINRLGVVTPNNLACEEPANENVYCENFFPGASPNHEGDFIYGTLNAAKAFNWNGRALYYLGAFRAMAMYPKNAKISDASDRYAADQYLSAVKKAFTDLYATPSNIDGDGMRDLISCMAPTSLDEKIFNQAIYALAKMGARDESYFAHVLKAAYHYQKGDSARVKTFLNLVWQPENLSVRQRKIYEYLKPGCGWSEPVGDTVASCATERKILSTDGNCQPCARSTVFRVLEKNPDGSAKRTGCEAKVVRPDRVPATPPRKLNERNFFQ